VTTETISDVKWEPLAGVKVLDLSTMFAGGVLTSWLADYGATVVKLEHPKGDPLRSMSVQGPRWETLNRSKRGICIDLSKPDGAALFEELAPSFDVILEGFRPGTLEKWGIDPQNVVRRTPNLVFCRLSGYGQTGPYSPNPAYGTVMEAYSSFALSMGTEEDPPILPSYGFGDHVSAAFGAFGVVMAIMEARTTGRGRVLDLSLFEPLMSLMLVRFSDASATGLVPKRLGNRGQVAAPRSVFQASDGWTGISVGNDDLWAKLAQGMGMPELATDPRYATNAARVENVEDVERIMREWTRERTREEVVNVMRAAGVPAGPVLNALELLTDPHTVARGSFIDMPLDDGRVIKVVRAIPRALDSEGRALDQRHPTPGPALGADTTAVLTEVLGLSEAEIDSLRASKVVL
jgi:crotonobetainyl-CoA:carnitine CoA-transferase CaiB-like acyl-CoA transferase